MSIALMNNISLSEDQILQKAQSEVARIYSNVTVDWLQQRYFKSIDRPVPQATPAVRQGGYRRGAGLRLGGGATATVVRAH
jgi:hypothetical protein